MSFEIADGYYMYRDKFRFAVEPGSKAKLGAPQFPPGTRKKDEFFGEVETYRKQVAIRLPVENAEGPLQLDGDLAGLRRRRRVLCPDGQQGDDPARRLLGAAGRRAAGAGAGLHGADRATSRSRACSTRAARC